MSSSADDETPGTTPGSAAWRLVQATELLRLCNDRVDLALRLLANIDSDLPGDGRVELPGTTLKELGSVAEATWQLAERIAQLTANPPEAGIEADYAQLADAAAEDLTQGMLDVERVRWAASLLSREVGWPALGAGLRCVDVRSAWGSVKIADILGAFRGAGTTRTRDTIGSARLPFDAEFGGSPAAAINRLATVLCRNDQSDE